MKRLFASFLLCLAMFALPIQGAAAAVMMVCSAAEAAGLSMTERHAAVKAEAEAEIGMDATHAHCHMQGVSEAEDQPVWHDAGDKDRDGSASALPIGTHAAHAGHHAGGMCSACAACAAGAMLLPEIPAVALIHQRHAAPLAAPAAFASYLPLPAERPPTPVC